MHYNDFVEIRTFSNCYRRKTVVSGRREVTCVGIAFGKLALIFFKTYNSVAKKKISALRVYIHFFDCTSKIVGRVSGSIRMKTSPTKTTLFDDFFGSVNSNIFSICFLRSRLKSPTLWNGFNFSVSRTV